MGIVPWRCSDFVRSPERRQCTRYTRQSSPSHSSRSARHPGRPACQKLVPTADALLYARGISGSRGGAVKEGVLVLATLGRHDGRGAIVDVAAGGLRFADPCARVGGLTPLDRCGRRSDRHLAHVLVTRGPPKFSSCAGNMQNGRNDLIRDGRRQARADETLPIRSSTTPVANQLPMGSISCDVQWVPESEQAHPEKCRAEGSTHTRGSGQVGG